MPAKANNMKRESSFFIMGGKWIDLVSPLSYAAETAAYMKADSYVVVLLAIFCKNRCFVYGDFCFFVQGCGQMYEKIKNRPKT